MPTVEEIKQTMIDAIKKDGEGRRIAGKNYFDDTGKRLWEPRENTFKKSGYATRSCSDIYYMETTEGQVDAYYIGGDVVIAHNGQERYFVGNKVRQLQKECKTARRLMKL